MKTLNPQELRSIEQFFQLKQEPLRKAMKQYLNTKYEKVIANKKYLIAVGNIPVGITSHLDTVFKAPPTNIYYDRIKNVMWSPEGLGADDRAGVFSIVQLIKMGYRPTVIFTTDEEIGGLGAEELVKDYPEAITDLKYIIEMDRRGSVDCVFYDCENPSFDEYVEKFGFVTNFGSFSDISAICPAWGVAGVNLSVGYYNEHSVSETLNIGQMFSTINKVKNMFDDIDNAEEFKYIPSLYSSKWFGSWGSLWDSPSEDDDFYGWDPAYGVSKEQWKEWMGPQYKCHNCGEVDYPYNLVPVKVGNETDYYCSDCVAKLELPICEKCGEYYLPNEDENDDMKICDDCKEN